MVLRKFVLEGEIGWPNEGGQPIPIRWYRGAYIGLIDDAWQLIDAIGFKD